MADLSGMDFNTRVRAGKKLEGIIIKRLKDIGVWVRDATSQEDMVEKIDGYIRVGGKDASLQIKHRETGDDIIFEIFKDTTSEEPNGRDFTGRAEWYACRDRRGRITMVPTEKLKEVVRDFLKDNGKNLKRPKRYRGAQFRNTTDNNSGQPKLMAYFPTSMYGHEL